MAKTMVMVLAIALIVIVMLIEGTNAKKIAVGGANGWDSPPSSDFYTSWAAKQSFSVGDTLVFRFTGSHTVARVTSKAAYDQCDTSLDKKPQVLTQSPVQIHLNSTGKLFFFCTFGFHCENGMKFGINVVAPRVASNSTSDAPEPSPSPSPPSPSPSSPSPSPSPSSPSSPSSSSSPPMALTSSFSLICLMALVMAFLY